MTERKKSVRRFAARRRNLPKDPQSLEQQFLSLHTGIERVAHHLKRNPHDYKSRWRFETLHTQRARCFDELRAQDRLRAETLMRNLNLNYSQPEEVANDNAR